MQTNNKCKEKRCFRKDKVEPQTPFHAEVLEIIEAIKRSDFLVARNLLKKAISEDMENPEVYNLLGVLYEKEGNRKNAAKCYRIAYYMDQTFVSATDNLERVCDFYYNEATDVNWGIKITEARK